MSRLIYRHPTPGYEGKRATVEYSDAEFAASWGSEAAATLDAGQPYVMGPVTVVDLVAFYNATCDASRTARAMETMARAMGTLS